MHTVSHRSPTVVRPPHWRTLLFAALATLLAVSSVACSNPLSRGKAEATATTAATVAAQVSASASVSTVATPAGEGVVIEATPPGMTARPSGSQTLTLAGSVDGPATLDPALVKDAESAFVVRQVFRGLVRLDDQLKPTPDLARRIEISPDGLRYTFTLYDDISFQDGRRITADDVKFSLERATDPALAGGDGASLPAQLYLSDIAGATDRMAGRANGLSGVEVVDRRTVRITLQAPAANFLLKLAGPSGDIVDRDNVAGGDWWRKPNGSGPFALTGWRARDRITLQAHQGYRPHPPTLKTVVILLGANALSPMALYERGQIDLTEVPIDDLDRVAAPTNPLHAQLVEQPLFSASYILINPNVPPFDSPQLRRALIQGFDRGKVASATFNGQVRAASGILPPGLLGRDWPATVPPYDLAAAKALLAQASGGKPPSSLTFYTAGSPALVSMKQVYERDLGLAVEVDELDWPDYMADMDAGRLPVFELSWVADYPDPEDFLRTLFYSTSPSNFIQYRNPDVDRLLDQAAKEMDPDRRAQLMSQAQQRIIDDGVVIPLYYDVSRMLIKPQIHGVTVTPLGILGLESVWVTR